MGQPDDAGVADLGQTEEQPLLTLAEAIEVLRIGRSLAYQLAQEYLDSGGTSGLPVIRLGEQCLRVPRWALTELVTTGRVVRLCDGDQDADQAGADDGHAARQTSHRPAR